MSQLALSSPVATVIFVMACFCGYQYRRVWKTEGPRYLLWIYGVLTATGLLVLGFVPLVGAG